MKTGTWNGTARHAAWTVLLAFSLHAGGAAAQGVSISGDYMSYAVPDYGSIALTQSILESTIDESRDASDARPASQARTRASAAAGKGIADWSVAYDPTVSRSVEREYLANIERMVGRERADAIGAHLRQQPAATRFDAFARPYGLSRNDLADVMAGYLALMWTAANRAPEPTRAQVQGLKRQILASEGPEVEVPASAAWRQRVAESLLYRTSQVAIQREIANRRDDTRLMRAVADNARNAVRQGQGIDLRRMQLTANGFESRRR
jgi:hypothetical protein